MAVYRVLIDFIGRDANDASTGEITYTQVLTVETDDPLDGPETFRDHPQIPQRNDAFNPPSGVGDNTIWCNNVRYVSTINRKVWRVIVSYSNRLDNPDEALKRPDLRKQRIEWDTITSSFATQTDNQGQPIRNTARDPFDPALAREDSWQLLRITRNQKTYNGDFYLQYHGKTNKDSWNRYKIHQVKFRKARATDFFEGGEWWFRVTFELEIKRSRIPTTNILVSTGAAVTADTATESYAWVTWVLNRGFREIGEWDPIFAPGVITPRQMTDPNRKIPIISPYPLNTVGRQLPLGQNPIYLGFELLEDINFAPLNIILNDDHTA